MARHRDNHQDVAASYCNISSVHHTQGKYTEALAQQQKSLEIEIRVFCCNHHLVATSYCDNNLDNVYFVQVDCENALLHYQKCLEILRGGHVIQ